MRLESLQKRAIRSESGQSCFKSAVFSLEEISKGVRICDRAATWIQVSSMSVPIPVMSGSRPKAWRCESVCPDATGYVDEQGFVAVDLFGKHYDPTQG